MTTKRPASRPVVGLMEIPIPLEGADDGRYDLGVPLYDEVSTVVPDITLHLNGLAEHPRAEAQKDIHRLVRKYREFAAVEARIGSPADEAGRLDAIANALARALEALDSEKFGSDALRGPTEAGRSDLRAGHTAIANLHALVTKWREWLKPYLPKSGGQPVPKNATVWALRVVAQLEGRGLKRSNAVRRIDGIAASCGVEDCPSEETLHRILRPKKQTKPISKKGAAR